MPSCTRAAGRRTTSAPSRVATVVLLANAALGLPLVLAMPECNLSAVPRRDGLRWCQLSGAPAKHA
ncbi:MAG: hypothetical protein CYG60_06160 [Actinobacteria bacterium]|nr:hypothetical protein [Actinomycetota bacterium]PLS86627.1 MAG: hypothetical protein CYG60_06160 [Actinomycetota bacterium]